MVRVTVTQGYEGYWLLNVRTSRISVDWHVIGDEAKANEVAELMTRLVEETTTKLRLATIPKQILTTEGEKDADAGNEDRN